MFPYSSVRLCLSNEVRILDLTMVRDEFEAHMPYIISQLSLSLEDMVRVYDALIQRAVEVVLQSSLLTEISDRIQMQTGLLIQSFPQLLNIAVHFVAENLAQETVSPSNKFKCLVSSSTAILVKEHYR